MLGELIAIVATIWTADSEMRDGSIVGQSEMDRRSRRWVSIICGTLIALLVIAGIGWEWISG